MRLDPLAQNTNSAARFSMGGDYYSQSEFQIDSISAPLGSPTYMANVPTRTMSSAVFSSAITDALDGQPFSNGTIPQSRISATPRLFQDRFFPEPSQAGIRVSRHSRAGRVNPSWNSTEQNSDGW